MELLEMRDVTIQYARNPKPTVENFNLKVKDHEIVSIVGESGSGKTTVIRSIMGLLGGGGQVTGGEIYFEGKPMSNLSVPEWIPIRGKDVSMIFQDSGAMLNPVRRIGAQFVEYIRAHEKISKQQAWDKGAKMLTKMRLPDAENVMKSYPFQLSGGMRQRVGIAMGMIFRPKLLLADEPTSALDVTIQAQIVRQLCDLKHEYGTSIIIVTHNIGVAAYMSEHMIVMKDGAIVDAGHRDDILHHPTSEYTKNLLAAVPELGGVRYVD